MIMKKNLYHSTAWLALLVMILALLGACNPKPEATGDQPLMEIKLGYCPTMQPHAQALAQAHQNVTLQQYENSGVALNALKAGQVQAVLIGRVAWQHEHTDDLRLVRLADGLTLIALHPGVIRFEDLPKIHILTHEAETAIQDLIPVRINVVYYEHFDEMRAAMEGSVAVLLRWSQVSLTDNLVIPVDGAGNKIAGFRSPHLYYLDAMDEVLAPLLNALPAE
jgi:hypothetical protein